MGIDPPFKPTLKLTECNSQAFFLMSPKVSRRKSYPLGTIGYYRDNIFSRSHRKFRNSMRSIAGLRINYEEKLYRHRSQEYR